jgi:hypothetical protein
MQSASPNAGKANDSVDFLTVYLLVRINTGTLDSVPDNSVASPFLKCS